MFCEVEHLVMTSVQVNVGKFTDACSPGDEIVDVIQQRHCTFDPDWRRVLVSNHPVGGLYLHTMLSV